MARIAVIGGTGYAGSHIVAEGVKRGHTMVSVARRIPNDRIENATYVEGTALDIPNLVAELEGVEVVVSALAPRDDMLGKVRPALAELAATLPEGVRLGVIGGAGGALAAPGGPRVIDTPEFADEYKAEASEAIEVLEDLQADQSGRGWFYIHPAAGFGAWNPGDCVGSYRDGGDVQVTDADGQSFISGADLAIAVIDEVETARHTGQRFTVGY